MPRVCEWCQKSFLAQPRDVQRGRGRFCCRECCGAAGGKRTGQTHPQAGRGNFNWRHGDHDNASRYTIPYMRRNPEKVAARLAVRAALESGRLVKPWWCEKCGAYARLDGHHDDYTKPLVVRWLCRRCHVRHHKAKKAYRLRSVSFWS